MKLTITYKNENELTFETVEWFWFRENKIEFFENKRISNIHGYEPTRISLENIKSFVIEE